MNMREVYEKLAECSAKIGMWQGESMSLDQLIASYLSVREANIEYMAEIDQMRKQGYDRGYEAGLEQVTEYEYIKLDDLRVMTMEQVAALLYTGE
jgi:hypothetical protein